MWLQKIDWWGQNNRNISLNRSKNEKYIIEKQRQKPCKIVIHEPCLGRPRFIMPALGPYKNQ